MLILLYQLTSIFGLVHDVQPYASDDFNVTHKINSLSFGRSIDGKRNPLDEYYTFAEKGELWF